MNAVIKIDRVILEHIIEHAKRNPNLECGGYVIGKFSNKYDNKVVTITGIYYEDILGTKDRFWFTQYYLSHAHTFALTRKPFGEKLIGCYHSHGEYPAIFSDIDRDFEKGWASNRCALIYSPEYNELVGDIITSDGEAIKARITITNSNLMSNKVKLQKRPIQETIKLR